MRSEPGCRRVVTHFSAVLLLVGGLSATPTLWAQSTVQPPETLYATLISGNAVTLRWDPPETGPVPTGYVLEGGLNPGEVAASIPTGSTAPVFTFVAPSGSFYVRVHTLAGSERSVASNEIRIHVNVPVVPAPPANFVATVSGANLNVAWWNNYSGGAPSSLLLDVTGSAALTIPLPLSDHFSYTGVPPGSYTLSLRARNAAGVSTSSNAVTLNFPGACSGPPLPPVAFEAFHLGSVIYTLWGPAISGPAPTIFLVNVSGAYSGTFPTAQRALSGAAAPGTYVLTVSAVNACGTSGPSGTRAVTIP